MRRALWMVMVVAGWLLGTGLAPAAPEDPQQWPLDRVGGGSLRLADYQGQVVLLNFWATWCPPCREEIPDLVKAQAEFGPQGFQVIGVNFMDNADAPQLESFAQNYKINYPLVTGDTRRLAKLAGSLGAGVMGLPTTLVLDRQGKVMRTHVGGIDYEQVRNLVTPLLGR